MPLGLPLLIIILIPITAIIDYYAFRKRYEREGIPITWQYFVVPCALECGMFVLGYFAGTGGL